MNMMMEKTYAFLAVRSIIIVVSIVSSSSSERSGVHRVEGEDGGSDIVLKIN